MQACPQMKAVISALAAQHNVDLSRRGVHFHLDLPGFDRLCIERIDCRRISVAHYFELNGDLAPEPDILFWINGAGDWIPVEISQSLTGWRVYARLNDDASAIVQIRPKSQRDLAAFAELWAQNLREQGWLEALTPPNPPPTPHFGVAVWPTPTVEAPDGELLAEWFFDSVCEATDGCPVEPDVAP